MNDWQPSEIIRPDTNGSGANILIVADHASNFVPPDVTLGIPAEALDQHIAIDIGVAAVTRLLCDALGCGAILAGVSRLVIDFNREEDAAGLIPVTSDGIAIPGNIDADVQGRLKAFHRPYHNAVTRALDAIVSPFILSLHSFTPQLSTQPEQQRPWDIGILYNRDDRAARMTIPMLAAAGLHVGDQLPYAGTILNATMNRHAEARGIPYLGVEMRQDHVGSAEGQARMANILAPVVLACRNNLA